LSKLFEKAPTKNNHHIHTAHLWSFPHVCGENGKGGFKSTAFSRKKIISELLERVHEDLLVDVVVGILGDFQAFDCARKG